MKGTRYVFWMRFPWNRTPDWAIVLQNSIDFLIQQETTTMAAIDDLNAAVTTLTTNFAAADTAIQAEITALTAALAANNTAAIEAAATNISAISTKMATDTAALAASLRPAPAPTP